MAVEFPADIVGLTQAAPLSRRSFMTATAASAAGYTLAAGDVRAEAIRTDSSGLEAGMAAAKVGGGEMPIYFAKPSGAQKPPVVIVCMEVFGLHEYIKDVTRRLGKLGVMAVAPNYYFRAGQDLTAITEIPKLMPIVNSKPDAELVADLDATVQWAKDQGGDTGRLGIVGFCRGGRAVYIYSAHSAQVKAAVAFYGSLVDPKEQKSVWPNSPTELAGEIKAPLLGLYGDADTGIPAAQVGVMKTLMTTAGKTAEFKLYPGAGHAFHADYRPSYRKEAADQGWAEAVAWFKRYGVMA